MNNVVTIVIPMAGRGQRFREAGYTKAKPFIDVAGMPMIERVLDQVSLPNAKLVLVMQKDFLTDYATEIENLKTKYKYETILVNGITAGAACTVLAARDKFGNGPLIMVDSDTIFINSVFDKFIRDALKRKLDISLLVMDSDSPSYSYCYLNNEGILTEIREKEVISNNACCGAYFFKDSSIFINGILSNLIYGKSIHGEFYLSSVCNEAILQGNKGGIYKTDISNILCIGTPRQLEFHLKNAHF